MPEPFPVVDRPPVEPRVVDVALWQFLHEMSEAFPGCWVLVGGQMVLLHGLEAGVLPERETYDADALVDVRVVPDGTARLSRYLQRAGLVLAGIGTDHQGHRFVGAGLSVDVLAPDNLGARATLTTIPPARTVEVPAGTRLLRAPRRVPVACGTAVALVPRPSLDAAIVGKAAALTLPGPDRHGRDLAFLLGLVNDVRAVRASLTRSDRRWLRYAAPLLDDQLVWRAAPDAAAARAALRFLLGDQ